MGYLKFNNVSTEDLGVVIQTPPLYEFAVRKVEVISIEGRNGDVILESDAYNNVNREYNLASIFTPMPGDEEELNRPTNFIDASKAFVSWLYATKGYARLEDSYEPNHFRLAIFRSGGQLPNIYDKATGMVVRFECKPQRFLKIGEIPIEFKNATHSGNVYHEINNTTSYVALPELVVLNGVVSIEVVNGGTLVVDEIVNYNHKTIFTFIEGFTITEKFTIESELQDVYTEEHFINDKAQLTDGFPKLYPGKNWIKINYNAENTTIVSVKPRWWVL